MGVGYDSNKKQLSKRQYALAGALSGALTRMVAQPLDVIKIRMQLQVEVARPGSGKYWGMFQCGACILKEEGLVAFWKGHIPAQLLSVSYGMAQFVAFEVFTKSASGITSENMKPLTHLVCGSMAGVVGAVASFPFDVLRTRLVAQGEPKTYPTLWRGITALWAEGGARTFYKGLSPAVVQMAPYAGLQFGTYTLFSSYVRKDHGGILSNAACGWIAGVIAKTIVYPLDVVKKRFQVKGFEEARQKFGTVRHYKGTILGTVKGLLSEGGIAGLFKGLNASLVKAGVATAFHFAFYEEIVRIMRLSSS